MHEPKPHSQTGTYLSPKVCQLSRQIGPHPAVRGARKWVGWEVRVDFVHNHGGGGQLSLIVFKLPIRNAKKATAAVVVSLLLDPASPVGEENRRFS